MDRVKKILSDLERMVGEDQQKQNRIKEILNDLDPVQLEKSRLVKCCDCGNGLRFGKVAKRKGRCAKVGHARRQKDSELYQIWIDWS